MFRIISNFHHVWNSVNGPQRPVAKFQANNPSQDGSMYMSGSDLCWGLRQTSCGEVWMRALWGNQVISWIFSAHHGSCEKNSWFGCNCVALLWTWKQKHVKKKSWKRVFYTTILLICSSIRYYYTIIYWYQHEHRWGCGHSAHIVLDINW